MRYVIKQNQTVLDVALLLYGSSRYAVKLVNDNPLLISITNTDIAGITVTYDETIALNIDANLNGLNTIPKVIDNSYFVQTGQSTYDLAIQFGYGIDRVIEFMNLAVISDINTTISGVINVPKIPNKIANKLILQNKILSTAIISIGVDSSARITVLGDIRITELGTYRIIA